MLHDVAIDSVDLLQFLSCVEAKDLFGDPEKKLEPPYGLASLEALMMKHTSEVSDKQAQPLIAYFNDAESSRDCMRYSLRELIAHLHDTTDLTLNASRLAWAARPIKAGLNTRG
jgi:hypothetical protein